MHKLHPKRSIFKVGISPCFWLLFLVRREKIEIHYEKKKKEYTGKALPKGKS